MDQRNLIADEDEDEQHEESLATTLRRYLDLPKEQFDAEEPAISALLPRLQEHNGADEPRLVELATALGARYEPQAVPDRPFRAEDWYLGALALGTRVNGGSSCSVAALEARHGLARVYDAAEYQSDSIEHYRVCLAEYERLLGPRHPQLGAVHNNFGMLWRRRWVWEPALAQFEAALSIFEEAQAGGNDEGGEGNAFSSEDSVETLMVVHNMGSVYQLTEELDLARVFLDRALKGRRELLGLDHPGTLETLRVLAGLERYEGNYDTAEKMYRVVFKGYFKTKGPKHEKTLDAMVRLGYIVHCLGRNDEAARLIEQGLKGEMELLGPLNPTTIWAQGLIGRIYLSLGRLDDAEKAAKTCIRNGMARNGEKGLEDEFCLLADIYCEQERWPEYKYFIHKEYQRAVKDRGADASSAQRALAKIKAFEQIEKDSGPVETLTTVTI